MARVAGGVLLAFGIGLAILAIWIVERMFSVHAAVPIRGVIVATVFFATSAFCLLTGYRLALNRPNPQGSLLSPIGWNILTVFFLGLGVAFASIAVWRGEYHLLVGLFCSGLLAYASDTARRAVHLRVESRVFPSETSLLNIEGFAPDGFRWGIEVLNDSRTPMEFVVSVLQNIVGLSEGEAVRTMLQIHRTGGVVIAAASWEATTRIAEAINAESRAGDHPLTCRAISREERTAGN